MPTLRSGWQLEESKVARVTVENEPLINLFCAGVGGTNRLPISARESIPRTVNYTLIKQSIFIKFIVRHGRAIAGHQYDCPRPRGEVRDYSA